MRIPLNDAPWVFKVDADAMERAGYGRQEALVRVTEFGVTVALRDQPSDTWGSPAIATDVTP